MDRVLSQTPNGRVFICPNCEKIHIEFHNFLFSFNKEEFQYFQRCFARMDGCYYEALNSDIVYSRKIIVPIGHKNASMMLNGRELKELQRLLKCKKDVFVPDSFLSVKEIGIQPGTN
ncbi:hypothetical protein J1N10_00220 [Carboxylicivirga sp. A043]|uniref:DUF6686 family protein n=1 Tax=Carboxylicivirga litoralis TaxID=2816963 RepID=UPI0021CB5BF4|nr:DUF6686 family protein [Carboxylicivirga sp. A043]MCU4154384.1 hypothetical protein [Carboxylicivirga sp. A043]